MVFPSNETGNADHEFYPRLGNYFLLQNIKLFKVAISTWFRNFSSTCTGCEMEPSHYVYWQRFQCFLINIHNPGGRYFDGKGSQLRLIVGRLPPPSYMNLFMHSKPLLIAGRVQYKSKLLTWVGGGGRLGGRSMFRV